MYCAVSLSSNTVVIFPSDTVSESLVQVTVVAGPPVEIQVNMDCFEVVFVNSVMPFGIVMSPTVYGV